MPRIYQRIGIPNSLLFHPLNYLFVFGLLLGSFSLPSAIYARVSTSILRNTLNNPGRGILVGLLPADLRGSIRSVLRGTVTRTGTVLGAFTLVLSKRVLTPRDLCWLGIILTAGWAFVSLRLKKTYGNHLLESLERSHMDVRIMGEDEVRTLLQDATATKLVMDHILVEDGRRCSFFAGLLARSGQPSLINLVIEVLPEKDPLCQVSLIQMLPAPLGDDFADRLIEIAPRTAPAALPVLVRRVGEQGCHRHQAFLGPMAAHPDPQVRMEASAGAYRCAVPRDREKLREGMITELEREQGFPSIWILDALGRTGDRVWFPWLKHVDQLRDTGVSGYIIHASDLQAR